MKERQNMKNTLRFDDRPQIRGILEYKVYRHKGSEKKLIDTFADNNLIVNKARTQMANLIAAPSADRYISKIGFGSSKTEAKVEDEGLTAPSCFIDLDSDSYELTEPGAVTFNWTLPTGEGNGLAIMEFGLICKDDTLFSRRTRNNPINKENDISIEGQWTIKF